MTLHLLGGSLDDDMTVFSPRDTFHLLSDHQVQKGPSFPKPIDVTIQTTSQSVKSQDDRGVVKEEHLEMPPDTSNGLPPNLLMNIDPSSPSTTIAFVVPSTKPRHVRLVIKTGDSASPWAKAFAKPWSTRFMSKSGAWSASWLLLLASSRRTITLGYCRAPIRLLSDGLNNSAQRL